MMNIRSISWNYGTIRGVRVHLIRLTDGSGLIRTNEEMIGLGLAKWKTYK